MGMRWSVEARLVGTDGEVIWGTERGEIVPDGADDPETLFLEVGQEMLDAVDDCKTKLSAQVAGSIKFIKQQRGTT